MSERTIDPAPTVTFSPILIFGIIVDPAPIKVFEPTDTLPHKIEPGAI